MKYKAIFFDRDGTLTYFDKEKELWRNQLISEWNGKPFELSYEKMMALFHLASEGKNPGIKPLMMSGIFSKDSIGICSGARVSRTNWTRGLSYCSASFGAMENV